MVQLRAGYRYDANQDKKNDKQEYQTPIQGECRPRVLESRINEDEGLIKAAEKACRNRQVQDDINAMEEQIRQGNMNPGIGSKPVGNFVGKMVVGFSHESLKMG